MDDAFDQLVEDIKEESIRQVTLSYSKRTPEQIQRLLEALKTNQSVTSLELSSSGVSCESAYNLGELLKESKHIEEIFAWNNNIGVDGAKGLFEGIKFNQSLRKIIISSCNIGPEGAVFVAEALRGNKTLTILGVASNNLGAAGTRAIAEALEVNDTLKALGLACNHHIDGQAIGKMLKVNRTLKGLGLSECSLSSTDMKWLCKGLEENKSLDKLDLLDNGLDDESAEFIGAMLKINTGLRKLGLGSNNLGSLECAKWIGKGIEHNHTLKKLSLGDIEFGPEAAKELGSSFVKNDTLEQISFLGNSLDSFGSSAILDSFARHPALVELFFQNEFMDSVATSSLGKMLQSNHKLKLLDLSNCALGNEGAVAIGNALGGSNQTLQQIILHCCDIKFDGAKVLLEKLQKNHTLKSLDLTQNELTNAISEVVAALIRTNKSIFELFLGYVGLKEEGIFAIGEALKFNDTLTSAFFESPAAVSTASFVDALSLNGSLTDFYGCVGIDEIVKRNVSMHFQTSCCVEMLLSIRRFRPSELNCMPKDVVKIIAQYLWATKTDVKGWKM